MSSKIATFLSRPRFDLPQIAVVALGFYLGLALINAGSPLALETQAREAFLFDFDTGTVLLEKDADEPMPPASMSKIMTIFMVFDRLRDGRLSLSDMLPVSEKAWRMGGSKMFVEVGKEISVENLVRGIVVQSGNDACVVVAEGLSGSEDAFATEMTKKAGEIGLTGSSFANATGWPHPDQRMTARDLASLAGILIREFPEYYHYFSEKEFTWAGISQGNRNPLIYRKIGADGLKTGHTEEAGYGLTASALKDGRRLVLVVNGLSSTKARAEEGARLMSWGFREFDNYKLFAAGDTVDEVPVWLGDKSRVPLVTDQDVLITLNRNGRNDMKVALLYDEPIPSPIKAGDQVARLKVSAPGVQSLEIPLRAGEDVEQLGAFGRIFASLKYLIFGAP